MSVSDIEREIHEGPREALPGLIGDLARLQALALARFTASTASTVDDRLLKIAEAASKLSVSTDYLYRHADKLPFTVRDGRRLRFSAHGIEQWITRRKGFRKS